jgi:Skp family chaperone for outer membrane proteins
MEIGVVDTGRVLNDSKHGKAVGTRLQALGERWQGQITLAEQRLDDAHGRLKKLQQTAAQAQVFKAQHEIRMLELSLRHLQEQAQTDLEAHSDFWQATLSQALTIELEKVGKAKNLSMVVTGPNAQIPFVAQTLDVTAAVVQSFDQGFKDADYNI